MSSSNESVARQRAYCSPPPGFSHKFKNAESQMTGSPKRSQVVLVLFVLVQNKCRQSEFSLITSYPSTLTTTNHARKRESLSDESRNSPSFRL